MARRKLAHRCALLHCAGGAARVQGTGPGPQPEAAPLRPPLSPMLVALGSFFLSSLRSRGLSCKVRLQAAMLSPCRAASSASFILSSQLPTNYIPLWVNHPGPACWPAGPFSCLEKNRSAIRVSHRL